MGVVTIRSSAQVLHVNCSFRSSRIYYFGHNWDPQSRKITETTDHCVTEALAVCSSQRFPTAASGSFRRSVTCCTGAIFTRTLGRNLLPAPDPAICRCASQGQVDCLRQLGPVEERLYAEARPQCRFRNRKTDQIHDSCARTSHPGKLIRPSRHMRKSSGVLHCRLTTDVLGVPMRSPATCQCFVLRTFTKSWYNASPVLTTRRGPCFLSVSDLPCFAFASSMLTISASRAAAPVASRIRAARVQPRSPGVSDGLRNAAQETCRRRLR